MIDLEGLWRMADSSTKVCSKSGATKNMVLDAIMNGARTAEEVKKSVALCGGECAKHNASGRPCADNVEAMLAVYLPIHDMMTEGGGCHHAKPKRRPELEAAPGCGKEGPDCAGCSGCSDKK